ncbi:MAG TPA: hypothetical protein PLN69_12015, partial [bacterium]|nr:hypothetical protein [bacterium]
DNACNTRRGEGVVREHTVRYVTDPEPMPQRSRTGVITIFRISHREIRVRTEAETYENAIKHNFTIKNNLSHAGLSAPHMQ